MNFTTADQVEYWNSEPAHECSSYLFLQAPSIFAVYFNVIVDVEKMLFENMFTFFFEFTDSTVVDAILLFVNIRAFLTCAKPLMLGQLIFMFKSH